MPTKKITAASIRQSIATAKSLPTNQHGRTIGQNLKQTLDKVKSVPATTGTGLIDQKGTN
jgi:hypothetical protein